MACSIAKVPFTDRMNCTINTNEDSPVICLGDLGGSVVREVSNLVLYDIGCVRFSLQISLLVPVKHLIKLLLQCVV